MELNFTDKVILFAFGCGSHELTLCRLKWIAALSVDEKVKRRVTSLVRKLDNEDAEGMYPYLIGRAREDMERYFEALRCIRDVEQETGW